MEKKSLNTQFHVCLTKQNSYKTTTSLLQSAAIYHLILYSAFHAPYREKPRWLSLNS